MTGSVSAFRRLHAVTMTRPATLTHRPIWTVPDGWVSDPRQVVQVHFVRRSHAEAMATPQLDMSSPNISAVIRTLGAVAAAVPSPFRVPPQSSSITRRKSRHNPVKPRKPGQSTKLHR